MDIGDGVSINSLRLCFLAVDVSFEVYFIAENVRGFVLLYEVETTGFLGCNTSLHKWSPTFKGTCHIHLQEFKIQALVSHVW